MKRHERTFETYQRNHKGQNYEDFEKSKIRKEKTQVIKLEKKAKNLMDRAFSSTDDDNIA